MQSIAHSAKSSLLVHRMFAAALFGCTLLSMATAWALDAKPPTTDLEGRDQAIRDRMRDYEAKIKADFTQKIKEWADSFAASRADRTKAAAADLVKSYTAIKKRTGKDADAMKRDPEFRKCISDKIVALLDADGIKDALKVWADAVEAKTRAILIDCFQQIVAEDLGRVFDENLRGKVVAAIKAIPIDDLVNNKKSADEIQSEILKALPDSAVTDDVRTKVKAAAMAVALFGTYTLAVKTGQVPFGKIAAPIAAAAAGYAVDAGLNKVNEHLTSKPDAKLIQEVLEDSLTDWNKTKLEPSLVKILESFGDEASKKVEDEARKIIYSRPK